MRQRPHHLPASGPVSSWRPEATSPSERAHRVAAGRQQWRHDAPHHRDLARNGPEPLRAACAVFSAEYRATGSFAAALDVLQERLADPVADRVVASLRIARDVGGTDLGLVLRTLSALLREDADHSWVSASGKTEIMDDFVVEFLLKPVRYTRTDGSETPFWSFYDYEALRDRLLSRVVRWAGPKKQRLQYISLAVESDQFAVSVAFRFRSHYRWCAEEDPLEEQDLIGGDGQPTKIEGNLCVPKSTYCGPAFDPPKDCEPCS